MHCILKKVILISLAFVLFLPLVLSCVPYTSGNLDADSNIYYSESWTDYFKNLPGNLVDFYHIDDSLNLGLGYQGSVYFLVNNIPIAGLYKMDIPTANSGTNPVIQVVVNDVLYCSVNLASYNINEGLILQPVLPFKQGQNLVKIQIKSGTVSIGSIKVYDDCKSILNLSCPKMSCTKDDVNLGCSNILPTFGLPCTDVWSCTPWGGNCSEEMNLLSRNCIEANNCPTAYSMPNPFESTSCAYDLNCNDSDNDGYGKNCFSGNQELYDCDDRNAAINPSAREICDNLDNDCDDSIDEECPCIVGTIRPCGSSTGSCSMGVQICLGLGWSLCGGQGYTNKILETCGDGKDNDCDGQIDENCPCDTGATQSCGDDNSCSKGLQTCVEGLWGQCVGEQKAVPEIEGLCSNNKDDDCDGKIDGQDDTCKTSAYNISGFGHCINGIQDADEESVDCGGNDCESCSIVFSCINDFQDGTEEGIDCGGRCPNDCAPEPYATQNNKGVISNDSLEQETPRSWSWLIYIGLALLVIGIVSFLIISGKIKFKSLSPKKESVSSRVFVSKLPPQKPIQIKPESKPVQRKESSQDIDMRLEKSIEESKKFFGGKK